VFVIPALTRNPVFSWNPAFAGMTAFAGIKVAVYSKKMRVGKILQREKRPPQSGKMGQGDADPPV
jgi:hypothetical protein